MRVIKPGLAFLGKWAVWSLLFALLSLVISGYVHVRYVAVASLLVTVAATLFSLWEDRRQRTTKTGHEHLDHTTTRLG